MCSVLYYPVIYNFSRKCEFVCLLEVMHMHFYCHLIIFRIFIYIEIPYRIYIHRTHRLKGNPFSIAIDFSTKHYSNTNAWFFYISMISNFYSITMHFILALEMRRKKSIRIATSWCIDIGIQGDGSKYYS